MRTFTISLCALFAVRVIAFAPIHAQAPDSLVQQVIHGVHIDSLISYVRILSGEDSVMIGSQKRLITSRANGAPSQEWAADYIRQTLAGFGLATTDQSFGSGGRNVFAIQPGTGDAGIQYLLCAHYDAVTTFCADDNASGTASVLESARLLSRLPVTHSIVYALWDQEEIGLNGSAYYAQLAHSNGDNIQGVINLEMFGWDSNNDGLVDIHTRPIAQSVSLAQTIRQLDSLYDLGLNPVIYNPGTTASDHSSFWNQGYSAVVFSEAYYGVDFNPYYHSSNDRIQYFNTGYFLKLSKLAAASMATYAGLQLPVTVADRHRRRPVLASLGNYPNPFNPSTTIRFDLDRRSPVHLAVYNAYGQKVATLLSADMDAGSHRVVWHAGQMASGVYFCRIAVGNTTQTKKLVLLR